MTRPRLLLVDEHRLFLEGLGKLLEPDYEVVGMLGNGHELVSSVEALRPDVISLDFSLPLLSGLDAARQMKERGVAARLIFISAHEDFDCVRKALCIGAEGYLLKRGSAEELRQALQRVLRGDRYVTSLIKVGAITESRILSAGELTNRQRHVLQLIAEGHTGKSIASLLAISQKTVEYHKNSLMKQLGLRSTAELTRYALKHGLVSSR